jgi:hypothetical protein
VPTATPAWAATSLMLIGAPAVELRPSADRAPVRGPDRPRRETGGRAGTFPPSAAAPAPDGSWAPMAKA